MVLIVRLNAENPKLINSLGPVLDLPTSWSLKPPSKQDQLHFVLELVNKLKQGMVPNFNQGAAQCSTHQHRWQVTGLAFSHRWRWWLSGFGHGFPAAGPSKILEPSHLLFWIWDATPSKETKVKAISDIQVGSVRTVRSSTQERNMDLPPWTRYPLGLVRDSVPHSGTTLIIPLSHLPTQ